MQRLRSADPERGSVAVMVALLLSGVLVVAAIVVDLGMVRARAIDHQTAADLAAVAAGDRLANADPVGACGAAIGSLQANLGVTTPTASTVCAAMGGTACSTPTGTAQATASVTSGKYVLSL